MELKRTCVLRDHDQPFVFCVGAAARTWPQRRGTPPTAWVDHIARNQAHMMNGRQRRFKP